VEMKSLLIGESASAESQQMIVAALEEGPEAVRVIHMRTVHISPDSLLVAAKIAVRESDTGTQVAAAIDAAEKRVRAALPIAKVIYLEPDIYRESQVDHTDPSITSVLRHRPPRPPRRPRPAAPADPSPPADPSLPADRPSLPASPPVGASSVPPGHRVHAPSTSRQQAQGAFLFEVQGAADRGGHAAQAPAEIGHGGAHRRLGQHPQAERQ
jgi:hypothetical protein